MRKSRRLIAEGKPSNVKLSKALIDSLDALKFPWEVKSPFEKRIEELRAFKAKFGHCNVTASKCASNQPDWSSAV